MYIVVFITAASRKQAEDIASKLIEKKLAACVNILEGVKSLFWWEGKVDRAKESLLIVKSRKDRLQKIIKLARALHSYDVPEVIALPIVGGYNAYLRWIDESVR